MNTPVRFLIDENLPPSLKVHLADLFPGSVHVRDIGLGNSSDSSIWDYAASAEFTILTKDRDFAQMAQWRKEGPPTVIQIRAGNCSVSKLVGLIRASAPQIEAAAQKKESLLDIGLYRETAT